MKVSISKKGYTLSGIPSEQLQVVMDILDVVGARCFKKDEPEDLIDGKVPSGSDFVMLLGFEELANFHGFKAGLWKGISKMLNKESRNPPAKKTRRG